jgi:predicted Zn-ribbon and HTH transcriptional regulator
MLNQKQIITKILLLELALLMASIALNIFYLRKDKVNRIDINKCPKCKNNTLFAERTENIGYGTVSIMLCKKCGYTYRTVASTNPSTYPVRV